VPPVFVLAHPLHAHRPPDLSRKKRGIGRSVLVAVSSIAPRSVDIDTADLVFRYCHHGSELLAQVMCCLRSAPARERPIFELGDGALQHVSAPSLNSATA